MNVAKEILNLYALPFYKDKNEFLDKIFSYLYARYKFKQLILLTTEELEVDLDLFDEHSIMVKEKKSKVFSPLSKKYIVDPSTIREIIVRIVIDDEASSYLAIKIQKKQKSFELVSEYKEYFSFLREYFTKNMILQNLLIAKQLPEPVQSSIPEITELSMEARPDLKQFYSINANKMPEEVDLVRVVDKIEKSMIREMLKRMSGKKSVAAKKLSITERMIGYKIRKYGL